MKYNNYVEMESEAERLVDRYVEHYQSDWELDKEWFTKLSKERSDSAVFIVRRCGTLLLPKKALEAKGAPAGQILSYYVDETLDGSKDNRFYLMDFRTCEMKKMQAAKVAKMVCM